MRGHEHEEVEAPARRGETPGVPAASPASMVTLGAGSTGRCCQAGKPARGAAATVSSAFLMPGFAATVPAALSHGLAADPLLEGDQAVQQRLGPGRTAGDIDVHGHDLLHAAHDGVGVVHVRPSRDRASAHGHDVLRVRHLLVEGLDDRHHLPDHGARPRSSCRRAAETRRGPRTRTAPSRRWRRPRPSSRWRSRQGRRSGSTGSCCATR